MKFSGLIEDLTTTWLLWMKNNDIVKSSNYPVQERRKAAESCETLINKEYKIIDKLDKFFE